MDTVLFFSYTVAYLALLAWGLSMAARHGWWTPANLPLLVVAGLVYDNLVLATGRFVGVGPLLETINEGRHWIHALITPVLVLFAWHAVGRTGAAWARRRTAALLALLATLALVALELTNVVGLSLAPQRRYGVLSYASTAPAQGPPLMVLLVSIALLGAGFLVWRRQGWPWLLVGTVIMGIGSAVPIPVNSGAVTNAFELVLLTSVLATKHAQDRAEDRRETAPRAAARAGPG